MSGSSMSGVPRFYSYRHHVSPAAPELHKSFIRKFLGRNEVQNCPIFFFEFVILEFLIHLTWFCLWFAHSTICLYFCSVCLSSLNLCFNFFGQTTRAISVLSRGDTVHNIDPSQCSWTHLQNSHKTWTRHLSASQYVLDLDTVSDNDHSDQLYMSSIPTIFAKRDGSAV